MDEEWKSIPTCPKYEASSLGRVRSIRSGRILRPAKDRYGYVSVSVLISTGERKTIRIHRLVYLAFKGSIPSNLYVHHIDECKVNNTPVNLTLVSNSHNVVASLKSKGACKYLGVSKSKLRFKVQIRVNGTAKYISQHATQEEAALAYNKVALEIHGPHAKLNVVEGV